MNGVPAFICMVLTLLLTHHARGQACPYIASMLPGEPNGFGTFGPDYSSDVDGDLLAVLTTLDLFAGSIGLRLIDVSDPAVPTELAVVNVTTTGLLGSESIDLRGSTLWVLWDRFAAQTELVRFDVSDPLNVPPPTIIATGRIGDFVIESDRLYVMNTEQLIETVTIYDISDPATTPILGSFTPFPGGTIDNQFNVQDGVFYQSDRDLDSTVRAWDVTNPAAPVLLGETFFPGVDLVINQRYGGQGTLLLVSALPLGSSTILDVSDPNNMSVVSSIAERGYWRGDQLLVTRFDGSASLRIYDLTDPFSPTQVFDAQFATSPGAPRSIFNSGGEGMLLATTSTAFGSLFPSELLVFGCDPVLNNRVRITLNTTITQDDTMIQGVPLADAEIEVGFPDTEATPGFILPGASSVWLTFEGRHTIRSVRVGENSRLSVNGSLTTHELELVDGAVLTHEQSAVTEVEK